MFVKPFRNKHIPIDPKLDINNIEIALVSNFKEAIPQNFAKKSILTN